MCHRRNLWLTLSKTANPLDYTLSLVLHLRKHAPDLRPDTLQPDIVMKRPATRDRDCLAGDRAECRNGSGNSHARAWSIDDHVNASPIAQRHTVAAGVAR